MLFKQFLLAGFVLLLHGLTSARYVGDGVSFVNDWHTVLSELEPRQASGSHRSRCRPLCGDCGSACSAGRLKKRNLFEFEAYNDTLQDPISANHLQKRVLQNVGQGAISGYLTSKTNALVLVRDNPNTNLIDLADVTPSGLNQYSYATGRRFADFTGNILNMGIQGLEGCTMVTVVSRSAVYMGHFFENLAFDPDGRDAKLSFGENCINLITGEGAKWRTRGDPIQRALFQGADNHAVAWIMTPREDQEDPTPQNPNPAVPGPTSQKYGAFIGQLTSTLQNIIPGITVNHYNYIAVNVEQQRRGYQGKALFEYDPNADGNNNANFRLWYEQNVYNGRTEGVL